MLSTVIKKLQLALAHSRSLYGHIVSDGRSLFAAIDEDGSETITSEELRAAMRRLDIGVSDTELDGIKTYFDANNNGTIEVLELLAATGLPDMADGVGNVANPLAGTGSYCPAGFELHYNGSVSTSSAAERAVRARQRELREQHEQRKTAA
eukprot:COSAG06_NODE_13243_length_1278_cov_56.287532_3_plen_150_part_01